MVNVQRYKFQKIPKQPNELARLKVIQGPDLGVTFVILGSLITIGRGDENDIILADLKASRKHTEISKNDLGWMVSDLGSQNGTKLNGQNIQKSSIQVKDTLQIGESILEFYPIEAGTKLLSADPRLPEEVKKIQNVMLHQAQKVRSIASFSLPLKGPQAHLLKQKNLLLIAVITAVAVLFLYDPLGFFSNDNVKKNTKTPETRDLASFLPPDPVGSVGTEASKKTADMFFKSGFREYREKNYLRAKSQFETVLQINPTHRLAKLYLSHSHQAIKDTVKLHLERGKKSQISGKLKDAKGHFESVLRLLHREPNHPSYVEAKTHLEELSTERTPL